MPRINRKKVAIEGVALEITKALSDYSDEAREKLTEEMKMIGKDAVRTLKKTSPKQTGWYAKNWKSTVKDTRLVTTVTIHNSRAYQLTHLLEHGHALPQGGKSKEFIHIAPVQDEADEKMIKAVEGAYG